MPRKMLAVLRCNKGVSLVELIISFAVVSILLTALFMICSTTYRTIELNRHDTHADIMLDNAADYIKNTTGKTCDDLLIYELGVAPSFDFSTAAVAGTDCYALAIINGRLYDFGNVSGETWSSLVPNLDDYRAFNDDYYNRVNATVGFRRNAGNNKWVEITLCGHREGNRITRERQINYSMLNDNAEIRLFDDLGAETDELLVKKTGDLYADSDIMMIYYKPTL